MIARVLATFAATTAITPLSAQPGQAPPMAASVDGELESVKAELARTRALLQAQEERLKALEARLDAQQTAIAANAQQLPARNGGNGNGVERVGAAPADYDKPPELAVLGNEGSVITRRGQFTIEPQLEYTRADRNRAVFRGVELVESVLIGVFDINESRQDVLTASANLRYGVSDRFEVGARIPYVYRSDASILAPIAGSTGDDAAATIDSSVKDNGLGDIELTARYQLTRGGRDKPFLIANLQGVLPTGSNPFNVPRDETGRALKAATGAGFFGIQPSITAILPTDPGVLFGNIGYTFNLPRNVNTRIPPVAIDRVDPGDAISASAGLGVSLNQRTAFNLGYAHSWGFGTRTRFRQVRADGSMTDPIWRTSRDLQIGRFLFGVTHRISNRMTFNWAVEVGATDDAADLRTVIRIPIVL